MGVGTPAVHSDCHTTTRSFSSSFVLPARGKAGGCPEVFGSGGGRRSSRAMTMARVPAGIGAGTVPAASNRV